MTFGNDRIILCPHCRKMFIEGSLDSGNTFGAAFCSDGRLAAEIYHCRSRCFRYLNMIGPALADIVRSLSLKPGMIEPELELAYQACIFRNRGEEKKAAALLPDY